MTNEEVIADLLLRSELTGLTVNQIWTGWRMIAQAKSGFDPLPPERWGDPHEDWRREPILDVCDFSTLLVAVPPPDAQVDLHRAWHEFEEDVRNIEYAMKQKLTIAQNVSIMSNSYCWSRFWALRDPLLKNRARAKAFLNEIEPLRSRARMKAARSLSKITLIEGNV